jgi:hypothetical protein
MKLATAILVLSKSRASRNRPPQLHTCYPMEKKGTEEADRDLLMGFLALSNERA